MAAFREVPSVNVLYFDFYLHLLFCLDVFKQGKGFDYFELGFIVSEPSDKFQL